MSQFVRIATRAGSVALAATAIGSIGSDVEAATPVPLSPPGILGLVLHHGRLLTVLDLSAPNRDNDAPAYRVVLAPPFGHLAIRTTERPQLIDSLNGLTELDLEETVRALESAIDAHEPPASQ